MKREDVKVGMKVKLLNKTYGTNKNNIEDFLLRSQKDCCIDFFKKNGYGIVRSVEQNYVTVNCGCGWGWNFSFDDIEPYVEPQKFKVGDKVKVNNKSWNSTICDYSDWLSTKEGRAYQEFGHSYIIDINEEVIGVGIKDNYGFLPSDLELFEEKEVVKVDTREKTLLEQLKENPNLELWKMSPNDTTYRVELKDGRTYKAKMLNANCGQFIMVTDIGLLFLKVSDIEAMYPKKDK